ncbi:MAG TPA: hypothetical protein PLS76_03715 [Acinetobacter sp.]|nr:hypothetical protein [Acinetobacter sp.]
MEMLRDRWLPNRVGYMSMLQLMPPYLAIENGQGTYQIVEDDLIYKNIKAKNELGFNPNYRWKI